MKNAAKAKKKAAAKAQNKRLRASGFKRSISGYQFPGINNAAIERAAKYKLLQKKLKKEGKKPKPLPEPKMSVKPMDPDGSYQVDFSVPMMSPDGEID